MATQPLPTRANLDQLRRQAKELKDAARTGDPTALERIRPYLSGGASVTLSAAQLAIARKYGFASWSKLKAEAEARTMDNRAPQVLGRGAANPRAAGQRGLQGRSGPLSWCRASLADVVVLLQSASQGSFCTKN